jgi:hypothetical protein
VHQLTRCAPLALNTTHPLSVQRMPAIVDHNVLPDMGRMTARLCSIAKMRSSLAMIRGQRTGLALPLIETCKLHGVDPQTYFTDVLTKLVNLWPASHLDELMPWAWAAEPSTNKLAA